MSRQIICVTQAIALEQLTNTFKKVSGVCVVDDEKRLIGIVSRKDLAKEGVSSGCWALCIYLAAHGSVMWGSPVLPW
jgi:CBS-domain-containing membrane protein